MADEDDDDELEREPSEAGGGYVTDPQILAQLGTPEPPRKQYVTNPGLLAQLGTPSSSGKNYVSDPALLSQLGTPDEKGPEAEGMLGTFARKARDAVLPTLGGISGGALAAGAAAGAGRVLGGAAGGFLGGPGGAVAGWLGGGLAGGYLGEKVYSAGKELLGYDDSIQQAVNAKTNPWSSAAGEVAPLALGLTPTTAAPRIGAKFLESPIGQRLLSGAVSGGAEAGMQVAQGEYDPTRLVTSLAAGAALPGNRGWVSGLEQRGEALAGRVTPHGTPGAQAAAGTAEEQAPPTTEGGAEQPANGAPYAKKTREDLYADPYSAGADYHGATKDRPWAAEPPTTGEEATISTAPIDPTIDAAIQAKLKPEAPEAPEAPIAPEPAPEPAPDAIPGPEAQARPLPTEPPEIVAPVKNRGPRGRDPGTYSLLEYLASRGGLRPSPELQTIFDGNPFIPGFGRLIRKTGKSLDSAWEAATRDASYINDPSDRAGREAKTSVPDLLRLIEEEARGNKQYQVGYEGTTTRAQRDRAAESNRVAIERAVDGFVEESGFIEIDQKLHARTIQIMEREGVSDPDIAFERAVMEDADRHEQDARKRKRQDTVGDIPGWDADDVGAAREDGGGLRATGPGPEPGTGAVGAAAGPLPRGAGASGTEERGAEGKPQLVIPGAGRISDARLAQRRADERLRPSAAQRPMDEGIFGDTHLQGDLLAARPPAKPTVGEQLKAKEQARQQQAREPQSAAPEPPAKFSIAKDTDSGRHVLFRNDEEVGDFANRGAAEQARTKAIRLERIREAAARANQIAAEPDETAPEGTSRPLGAAAAGESIAPGQPSTPAPPGYFANAIRSGIGKLFDIGRDLQMRVSPMARGTQESMATAKDFANTIRGNRWDWSRIDQDVERRFTPEQRKRMWDAADEESVMRQSAETSEHMGLATLTPEERASVEELQARAQAAWEQARNLGMVEGEGLPSYTPRMLINVANAATGEGSSSLDRIGANLRTTTPQMRSRKYLTAEETEAAAKAKLGEDATIARDIRTLPLATAKLEDAIAGRTLINNIREIGKRTGQETVVEGAKPSDPEHSWFTLDHPAFQTWRPRYEEADTATYREAVKRTGDTEVPPAKIPLFDRNGKMVFEQTPIYVRGDFEGPLRSVLTQPSGLLYKAAMDLKGKTMSLVMNSPLIHNAVEWGRALPAMPGKVATFKIYFEGNRAKNDPAVMREAVDNGLVPIGKRFFNQDISSIMEEPNLTPGRSWTAKVLGQVAGLFDPKAGETVKRSIDRAGDFWHNTLLWDRVGDLQMGLYSNFRADLIAKGTDPQSAGRVAAHWANRYAGALPQEAMSDGARKFTNLLLFSRTFTLGNLGAMKDMVNGLPRDVRAQISRDIGSLDPKADGYIKSLARRKAISIVMLDMGLMYIGNSLLQSGLNVMRGDKTLDEEGRGYADRLYGALQNVREHPSALLQPFSFIEKLSSTAENEPNLQDRILVGHAKDGTAIYARNPVGKIGEEFVGWPTGPLDMLKRKLGTFARPAWQILSNDQGFGRKVYDPNADTPAKYLKNMGLIVQQIVKAQTPEGQIGAAADLATGQGDPNVAAAQTFGPIAGVTFRHGAPGGPAIGELLKAREQHNFEVNEAMPNIRRMIQRGDEQGARQRMRDLGIPPGLQNFYVKTTKNPTARLSPRAVQDFNIYATPEQRERLQRQRQLVQ